MATPQVTVQDEEYKYTVSGDGMRELFHLAVDPGELDNLIESHPAETQRLADYLAAWLNAVPMRMPSRPGAMDDLDPEFLKVLRSLGYVGE